VLRTRFRAADPPISGAAISHEDLTLKAADGKRSRGVRAMPMGRADRVVILPDVRGLYHFYEELALRFAEQGYVAVAIDYFGRTAGVAKRGDDFDYMEHVQQTKPGLIQEDVGAGVRQLRALDCTAIFTVGSASAGATRGSPRLPGTD